MTQFIAVEAPPADVFIEGVYLRPFAENETLFREAAATYFRDSSQSHLVVDAQGLCESLVDEVWKSGAGCPGATDAKLVRYIARLFEKKVGLLLWCGDDFLELPVCGALEDVLAELQNQTTEQPADVWLACLPGK